MRLHRTGFYRDMSNVNKNITVEAKLISLPTYMCHYIIRHLRFHYLSEVLCTSVLPEATMISS